MCKRRRLKVRNYEIMSKCMPFLLAGEFRSDDRAHTERIEEATLVKAAPSLVYKLEY
jgi:hypothetical protein